MRLDQFSTWSLLVALSLVTIAESGSYSTKNQRDQGSSSFKCKEEGYHADPQDCSVYYRCVDYGNDGPLVMYKFECGPGTVFSKTLGDICTHPYESERKECGDTRDKSDTTNDVDSNNKHETGKEKPGDHGKPESRPPTPPSLESPSYVPPYAPGSTGTTAGVTQTPFEPSQGHGSTSGWTSSTESINRPSTSGARCERVGFMADPRDCEKFYRCVDQGTGSYKRYEFNCGVGTVWDPKIETCNHAWAANRVGCKVSAGSDPPYVPSEGSANYPGNENYPNPESPPCPPETTPPSAVGQQGYPGSPGIIPGVSPSVPTAGPDYSPQRPETSEPQGPSSAGPPTGPDSGSPQKPQGPSESQGPSDPSTGPDSQTQQPQQQPSEPQYPPSSNGVECTTEGFFGNPNDCRKFHRCVSSGSKLVKYDFECGEGTVWDDRIENCNHAYAVPRCNGGATGTGENGAGTVGQRPDGSNEIGQGSSETSESGSLEGGSETGQGPSETPESSSSESSTGSSGESSVATTESTEDYSPDTSTQDSTGNSGETSSPGTKIPEATGAPDVSSPTSTQAPTYLPVSEPQKPGSSSEVSSSSGGCANEGFFPDPQNCKKFYRCVGDSGMYIKYEFQCGEGTAWDDNIQSCNYIHAVSNCGTGSSGNPPSEGSPATPPSEGSSGTRPSEGSPGTTPSEGSSGVTSSEGSGNPPSEGSSETPPSEASSDNPSTEGSTSQSPSEESAGNQEETSPGPDESTSTSGTTSETSSSEPATTDDGNESASPPVSSSTGGPDEVTEAPAEGSPTSEIEPITESPTTVASTSGESSEATTAAGEKPPGFSRPGPSSGNQQAGGSGSKCREPGFFANDNDCTKFYRCVGGGPSSYTKYEFSCAPGTAWDQRILTCNHRAQVTTCEAGGNNEIGESSPSTESSGEIGSGGSPTSTENVSGVDATSGGDSPGKPVEITGEPESSSESSSSSGSSSSSESSSSSSPSSESTSEEGSSESGSSAEPCDTPTQSGGNNGIVCNKAGFYGNPRHCDKFYRCVDNGNGFNVYHFDCPPGTIFDPSINVCNYPGSVYPARDCKGGQSGSGTPGGPETSEKPPSVSPPSEETSTSGETTAKPEGETTSEETTGGGTSEEAGSEATPGDSGETSTEDAQSTTSQEEQQTVPDASSSTEAESSGTTTSTEEGATSSEQNPATTETEQESMEGETPSTGSEPGETSDSTTSGETNDSTTSGETNDSATSGETSGSTTSGETSDSTTSGETSDSTTSGETSDSTTSGETSDSTTSGETNEETTTGGGPSEVSGTTPCPIGALTGEQMVLICPTGFKRHPKYCNIFYQCVSESDMEVKILSFNCPENEIFDDDKVQCLPESESSQPCTGTKAGARVYRRVEESSTALMQIEQRETLCPGVGHYPYREGCSNVFYKCKRDSRENIQGYLYKCPENFVYWSVSRRCERASRLPMCSKMSHKSENYNNKLNSMWQLPVEDDNISARMLRYR